MKIVFLDTKTMGNVPNLNLLNEFGEVTLFPKTLPAEALERLADTEIAITCKVVFDKALMQKLPKLKLICVAATGMNNIDLDFACKAGIEVKNVANYSTNSVAQATFSLLLSLLNHTAYYDAYVKSGLYEKSDIFTHFDRNISELYGKQFGIIGLGSIGKRVAEIAEAFGCIVGYYSTSGKNKSLNYERMELEQLLLESDIVSIHAPLNDNTENLLNYEKIKLMKPTAVLLNAGRGGIVDEADLARALNENLISCAGFDVFSKEPIDPANPLLHIHDKDKIIFSPHCAWASLEARTLLIERIAENIKQFIHS
jgi:lactate dehydrogenase-like 2-hydroxyacid dehydrogenase